MQTIHRISLKAYTTFAVDAYCCEMVILEHESEIARIPDLPVSGKYMILGGGSNVLFAGDFDGTILQLKNKGITVVHEDAHSVCVKVAAGELWEDFVDYCVRNRYYGAENLAGIPGWVGSAPVQNIGAYGVEVKDIIQSVEGYDLNTGEKMIFGKEECRFDYRSSVFKTELKNKFMISHVFFTLSRNEKYILHYTGLKNELESTGEKTDLGKVREAVLKLRDSKLPQVGKIGSAGSFFKNPIIEEGQFTELLKRYPEMVFYPCEEGKVKISAGYLIESCGWKGYREGDAGIYPRQALVVVNYGNASGQDIVRLYKRVEQSVKEKFGIAITPEVNIIE